MILVITQAEKAHDANQLHDELIAAGINPHPVHSFPGRTEFTLPDAQEAAARAVVASHTPVPRTLASVATLWNTYKANKLAATTIAQMKVVDTTDLGNLLKAIHRRHPGDVNGS